PLIATLDHPGGVIAAAFSPKGRRLRTISRPAPSSVSAQSPGWWLTEWDLNPDERKLDEIRGVAALVARRTLNEQTRELTTMTIEQLQARWADWKSAYRAQFPLNEGPEVALRYHAREAHRAEAVGLWRTARWHLDRAIDQAEKRRKFR